MCLKTLYYFQFEDMTVHRTELQTRLRKIGMVFVLILQVYTTLVSFEYLALKTTTT